MFILLVTGASLSSLAQTQFCGWLATFQNYRINNRVGFYFDAQLRSTDQLNQVQALLIRPGVNFYLGPQLTATAGYAYIPHRKTLGGVTNHLPEHRSWQQLLFTHKAHLSHHGHRSNAVAVSHRLRLEQRYLPKPYLQENTLKNDGFNYAGRLRYFVRGVVPLNDFFAAAQNEIFFNVGDASAVNGKSFDQNRAYLAFGYRFAKQLDAEIGYMNQYISGAGNNSTNNHILQVATYLHL